MRRELTGAAGTSGDARLGRAGLGQQSIVSSLVFHAGLTRRPSCLSITATPRVSFPEHSTTMLKIPLNSQLFLARNGTLHRSALEGSSTIGLYLLLLLFSDRFRH